jgi:TonB-dependent receptor
VPVFYDPSQNLLDLHTYQWNNFSARFDINNLSEDAYKLDFTRNIDFAGFKLLDFGARFATREVDRVSDRFMNSGGANLDGIRNLGDMEEYQPGFVTDFFGPSDPIFDGFSGNIPRTWVAPKVRNRNFWEEYQNVLVPNAMRRTVQNFPYVIEEDTTALYVAGRFNYDWGSVPVSGNVGVRYVKTDINSTGRVLEESALEDQETLDQLGLVCNTDEVFTDISNGNRYVNCTATPDYSNTLPSFNINFGLRENLYLRFGAARVMSRPNPADLSPSVSIPQGQGSSGTSGNPDLDPFEADQFDLSVEWYIDQINTLTGAIFYKDVKNFITRTRTTYPSTVDNNEDGVIDDLDDVSIIRPVNGGTAEISGVELAWQGTLNSVTDSWWGGFGGQVNYTYVDSEQEGYDDITGQTLPYPDLSEDSYNLILFYEKYGLSARLAYNWRDASYRGQGGRRNDREGYQTVNEFGDAVRYQPAVAIFNDDYGQLDATLSYQFNPMFTIYVQGTNLTDELITRYASVPQATQFVQSNGRTLRFGLRGRF